MMSLSSDVATACLLRRVGASMALAGALLLAFPADALAYIDPATGSLVYQMALAVLLGMGLVFRRAIHGAVLFLGRLFGRKPDGSSGAGPSAR